MAAIPLQIEPFLHARFPEQMVASPNPLFEAQFFEHGAHVIKTKSRIRRPAQNPLQCLRGTQIDIVPPTEGRVEAFEAAPGLRPGSLPTNRLRPAGVL